MAEIDEKRVQQLIDESLKRTFDKPGGLVRLDARNRILGRHMPDVFPYPTDFLRDVTAKTVDIIHTAEHANDHALEVYVDTAGFGDVKAIELDYITGALAAGTDDGVMLVNIDETEAIGGDVFALEILATDGSAGIYGMKAGALVGPIHQDAGTFANPTTGTDNTTSTDVANMIDGDSGTTTAIFENNSEYILIGAAAAFEEIEFILTTGASGGGIKPTFWYSTAGAHQFTQFTPVDGTSGFNRTGVVAWDASDLTSHGVNTDTGTYDIKIIRTRSNLTTSPVLGYAKTAATTEYIWDKSGDINIRNLTASSTITDGSFSVTGGVITGATETNWDAASAHVSADGSSHADVATNTTHIGSNGTDHANVVTNDSHVAGDGSDHADVATNTTGIATNVTAIGLNTAAGHSGASRARAYQNAATNQVIASATWTQVTLDVENWDNLNEFTGSTFTATIAGYYQVNACIGYVGNVTADRTFYIMLGAVPRVGFAVASWHSSIASEAILAISDTIYLGIGDDVALWVYQGTGGNLTINGSTDVTFMSVHRLS